MKKNVFWAALLLLCCLSNVHSQTRVLINTANWNQRSPYNSQVPLHDGVPSLAGCLPVAYAIIMHHWGWPEHGVGVSMPYTTRTAHIEVGPRDLTIPYDWPAMGSSYAKNEQADEVARLIADIGACVQTDYTASASAAFTSEDILVNRFGYHPSLEKVDKDDMSDSLWCAMLREELDENRPVLYSAGSYGGRHAFVVDGYDCDGRFHVNWGWGGSGGWYKLDSLIAGFDWYDRDHYMIKNIKPNRELYADVSEDNKRSHLDTMTLTYDKKKQKLVIQHPRYAFVEIHVNGADVSDKLHNWGTATEIPVWRYPDSEIFVTVFFGPYTKTLRFQTVKK